MFQRKTIIWVSTDEMQKQSGNCVKVIFFGSAIGCLKKGNTYSLSGDAPSTYSKELSLVRSCKTHEEKRNPPNTQNKQLKAQINSRIISHLKNGYWNFWL